MIISQCAMLVHGSVVSVVDSVLVLALVSELMVSWELVLVEVLVLVAVLVVVAASWFEVLVLALEFVLATTTKSGRMSLTARPDEALASPRVAVTDPRPPVVAIKVPSWSMVPTAGSADQIKSLVETSFWN